jgi:predicted nucleic acid-binding protein
MTRLVIDASIAIKWVVQEAQTHEALTLRKHTLLAPDLLVAECANILWKKALRGELTVDEATAAALLLEKADIELAPMRTLLAAAVALAIRLNHAAYDCLYLALAEREGVAFATADLSFVNKVRQAGAGAAVIGLSDAALL